MKFHCSDFYDFKGNLRPWVDYGLDEEASILKYFYDIVKIYDADECGDEEYDFVFENGTAWKLYYSWYITYDPDWKLMDEYHIEAINLEEAKCMKKYRDVLGTPHHASLNKYLA